MQVSINPYHRSVTIDGEEIIQKFIPFPDDMNSLATVTCTYDTATKKITNVTDIHRYVNHYIEKEYYYDNLPKFIEWFYAEKTAQAKEVETVASTIAEAKRISQESKDTINSIKSTVTEAKEFAAKSVKDIEDVILEATGTLPVKTGKDLPKRTLRERFAGMINVKDYGAYGNGMNDDTPFIKLAEEAAIKEQSGILFFPVGIYSVTELPTLPAYGSGVIDLTVIPEATEENPDATPYVERYQAFDFLFDPNGFIVRDKETGKYKLDILPDDEEDSDTDILPISPINTQEIINEDCTWKVPVTGTYSIMLIGGGDGGAVIKHENGYAVKGGSSGLLNHFYKFLEKDTEIEIVIGQGGFGHVSLVDVPNWSLSNTIGGITVFDIHTSHNYPNRCYHSSRIDTTSYAEQSGQGLGGGWIDDTGINDGSYYGAGGAAIADVANNRFEASNGHRGAVILLYCTPETVEETPEAPILPDNPNGSEVTTPIKL